MLCGRGEEEGTYRGAPLLCTWLCWRQQQCRDGCQIGLSELLSTECWKESTQLSFGICDTLRKKSTGLSVLARQRLGGSGIPFTRNGLQRVHGNFRVSAMRMSESSIVSGGLNGYRISNVATFDLLLIVNASEQKFHLYGHQSFQVSDRSESIAGLTATVPEC